MISQDDIDAFKEMQEPPSQAGLHQMPKDWDNHIQTPLSMVRDFARKMNQPLDQEWYRDIPLESLRYSFIEEEFEELGIESSKGLDPENMLKEIADLAYVLYGYAATYGWDLDEAIRRVHLSNLSKLGPNGKPTKNKEGKVIKGPNYKKPNLLDLVETTE